MCVGRVMAQAGTLWQLAGSSYLPAGCEAVTTWEQSKTGMAGELTHLRVVNQVLIRAIVVSKALVRNKRQFPKTGSGQTSEKRQRHKRFFSAQGLWHPLPGGGGCGVEIVAVAAPPALNSSNTTALLRVTSVSSIGASNTSYLRAHVAGGASTLTTEDAADFYAALLAQTSKWGAFIDAGAKAAVPQEDRRYTATAASLLTMYLLRSILVQQPVRFKLGGRPVLSARFNVETAGSERKRPEI